MLLTNHSQYVCPCICIAKWRNKNKNTTVRFSVGNCTNGCQMYYYKHQYSNDLWPLKIKRNCILLINRSKLLIKLIIKNAVGLILDNFGIVGFLFFSPIPVDSSHFSLHFDNILRPKAPKYFILNVLKSSLILAYGPTGGISVLNITLLVGGNAGKF